HPVRAAQGGGGAHLRGFLALDGREGADAALALQADHALVEAAPEEHGAVQPLQLGRGNVRGEGRIQIAVAVENRQVLDLEAGLEDSWRHVASGSSPLYPRHAAGT